MNLTVLIFWSCFLSSVLSYKFNGKSFSSANSWVVLGKYAFKPDSLNEINVKATFTTNQKYLTLVIYEGNGGLFQFVHCSEKMPYTHARNTSEIMEEFPNSIRFNDFVKDKERERQTLDLHFQLKALPEFRYYYLTLCNCPTYDQFVTKQLNSGFINIEDYDIEVNVKDGFCRKKSYEEQQLFSVYLIVTICYCLLSFYCLYMRMCLKNMNNLYTVINILFGSIFFMSITHILYFITFIAQCNNGKNLKELLNIASIIYAFGSMLYEIHILLIAKGVRIYKIKISANARIIVSGFSAIYFILILMGCYHRIYLSPKDSPSFTYRFGSAYYNLAAKSVLYILYHYFTMKTVDSHMEKRSLFYHIYTTIMIVYCSIPIWLIFSLVSSSLKIQVAVDSVLVFTDLICQIVTVLLFSPNFYITTSLPYYANRELLTKDAIRMKNRSIIQNNVKFSAQKVLQIEKILTEIEAHCCHVDEMIKDAVIKNRLNIQLSEYENQKKTLISELEFENDQDQIYNDVKEMKRINDDTDQYEKNRRNRNAYKIDTLPNDINQSVYSECKITTSPRFGFNNNGNGGGFGGGGNSGVGGGRITGGISGGGGRTPAFSSDRPISLSNTPANQYSITPPLIIPPQQPQSNSITPHSSVKLSGRKLSSNTEVNIRAPSPGILQDYLKRDSMKKTSSGQAFKRFSNDLSERKESITESTKLPLQSAVVEAKKENNVNENKGPVLYSSNVEQQQSIVEQKFEEKPPLHHQPPTQPISEIHPYRMARLQPIESEIVTQQPPTSNPLSGPSPPPHEPPPPSANIGRSSRSNSGRPRPRFGSNRQVLKDANEGQEEKVSSMMNNTTTVSDPYSVNNNEVIAPPKPYKLPPLSEIKEDK